MQIMPKELEFNALSVAGKRERILALEATCKKHEQVELTVKHYFASGVYARELHIPAGTCLVGKIHNFPQINVLSQGKIAVVTEEGYSELEAPLTFVSPSGTKRAGYTLTDTVWTTFHASIDDDVSKIEQFHIAPSYDEYNKLEGKDNVLGSNSHSGDISR